MRQGVRNSRNLMRARKEPNTTIETSDDSLPLPYYYDPNSLLFSVLEDAVKSGYASKIPDYISYAKCYTKEFGFLAYAHKYEGYYKSVGETIEEVRGKLVAINNLMKNKIEAEYDSHKDSFLFGKYANRKNDFIKEVLRVCQACFTPKLHEHPIFQAKEVPIKSLICPNCGSEMPFYAKYCGHCGFKLKI
jgi:ribosomal protein L40E